jgi:hypothetical protein
MNVPKANGENNRLLRRFKKLTRWQTHLYIARRHNLHKAFFGKACSSRSSTLKIISSRQPPAIRLTKSLIICGEIQCQSACQCCFIKYPRKPSDISTYVLVRTRALCRTIVALPAIWRPGMHVSLTVARVWGLRLMKLGLTAVDDSGSRDGRRPFPRGHRRLNAANYLGP